MRFLQRQRDDRLPSDMASLRRSRLWAGIAASAGVLTSVGLSFVHPVGAVMLLGATWPLTGLAYLSGALFPFCRRRDRGSVNVEDLVSVISRAEPSLTWPLVGACLLLPLSIHLLVFLGAARLGYFGLPDFGLYMGLSSVLLIPTYYALIDQCRAYAKRLAWAPPDSLPPSPGFRVLGYTTLAAAFPGIFLAAIPPMVVGLTGAAFIPALFALTRRMMAGEQTQLVAWAGRLLKEAPEDAFSDALRLVFDRSNPARATALRFLIRNYDREKVRPVLDALLREADMPMNRLALRTCFSLDHCPPAELLVETTSREDSVSTTLALDLLTRSHGPNSESILLELVRGDSEIVRSLAIEALVSVGTKTSIAELHRARMASPAKFAAGQVDDVIERIKRRLASPETGALSMLSDGTGTLGMVRGEAKEIRPACREPTTRSGDHRGPGPSESGPPVSARQGSLRASLADHRVPGPSESGPPVSARQGSLRASLADQIETSTV